MISGIIGAVFAILFVLAILNWRAFARLIGVASAQVGKAASSAEKKDPVAMAKFVLEKEKVKLREANENRAKQDTIVTASNRMVNQLISEVASLKQRLNTVLQGEDKARQLAVAKDLKSAEVRLEKARGELTVQTEIYENFKKQCEICEEKIRTKEKDADNFEQQLSISKASAEMAEISSSLLAPDGNLNDVNKHLEEAQKQIDLNNSRGKVSRERNAGALAIEDENRKMQDLEAEELLAQYKLEADSKKSMDQLFPEKA